MKLSMLSEANRTQLAKEIEQKGYDQEDVADLLDVDPSTVSRHISNTRNPSYDTLKEYVKVLGSQVLKDFGLASGDARK